MWTAIMILVFGLFLYPLLFLGPAILGKYDKDIEDVCHLIKKQNCSRHLEDGSIYFPTRRSMTLTILIGLLMLSLLIQAIFASQLEAVLGIGIVFMIFLWVDLSTGYTVTSTQLLVKCANFRGEINLETLKKVAPSNNPISAPALSMKRMEISTTDGALILISPVEEELFLKILKERSAEVIINWP